MTFTTNIKEELTEINANPIEAISELAAFLRFHAKFSQNTIEVLIENPKIARRIYKFIKGIYGVNIIVATRTQKRFRLSQIHILKIKEKYKFILESLNIEYDGKKILPKDYLLESDEEKKAFLKGIFLSCGSISDPNKGAYHMEFISKTKKEALLIQELLLYFNVEAKILKRGTRFMIYTKNAEGISEFLKLFGAVNNLFYFEDIRIYRDHKNMVNRLNNCEVANQEKIIQTGIKQLEEIKYLTDNNLLDLLDEKLKLIIDYRTKYPEESLKELAEIISMETEKNISKSGVNHAFIKMRELIKKHKKKTEE